MVELHAVRPQHENVAEVARPSLKRRGYFSWNELVEQSEGMGSLENRRVQRCRVNRSFDSPCCLISEFQTTESLFSSVFFGRAVAITAKIMGQVACLITSFLSFSKFGQSKNIRVE